MADFDYKQRSNTKEYRDEHERIFGSKTSLDVEANKESMGNADSRKPSTRSNRPMYKREG